MRIIQGVIIKQNKYNPETITIQGEATQYGHNGYGWIKGEFEVVRDQFTKYKEGVQIQIITENDNNKIVSYME